MSLKTSNTKWLIHFGKIYKAYRINCHNLKDLLNDMSKNLSRLRGRINKFDGKSEQPVFELLDCIFKKVWKECEQKPKNLMQIGLSLWYGQQICQNCDYPNFYLTLVNENFENEYNITELIMNRIKNTNNCNTCNTLMKYNSLSPSSKMVIFNLVPEKNVSVGKAKRLNIPYTFEHLSVDKKTMKVHLYAVITQHQIPHLGPHYKCYLRCDDETWYECDDDRIESGLSRTKVEFFFQEHAIGLIYINDTYHLLKSGHVKVNHI